MVKGRNSHIKNLMMIFSFYTAAFVFDKKGDGVQQKASSQAFLLFPACPLHPPEVQRRRVQVQVLLLNHKYVFKCLHLYV